MSKLDRDIPPQCPKCLKFIELDSDLLPGALAACMNCVTPLMINGDLTARVIDPEEMNDDMMNKLIAQLIEPKNLARILKRSRAKPKKSKTAAIAININRAGLVKIKVADADPIEVTASVAHQIGIAICEAAIQAALVDDE